MVLFVLVGVGSPGKTTIINSAQDVVKKSPFYLFSPIITTARREDRDRPEGPEGDSKAVSFADEKFVSDEEFKQLSEEDGLGLTWKDRLTSYALLKEVVEALEADKKVVISAPATALPELEAALSKYGMTIVRITASPELLAARKTGNKAEVKLVVKKIAKLQNDLKARTEPMLVIDNSGTVDEATQQLLLMMGFDAAFEIPPPDANDLQNCLPQDYLKRTVFPCLAAGLTLLDTVRPADPVDFLAMYLHRSATTTTRKVAEMREQQRLRTELRKEVQLQYDVEGRI